MVPTVCFRTVCSRGDFDPQPRRTHAARPSDDRGQGFVHADTITKILHVLKIRIDRLADEREGFKPEDRHTPFEPFEDSSDPLDVDEKRPVGTSIELDHALQAGFEQLTGNRIFGKQRLSVHHRLSVHSGGKKLASFHRQLPHLLLSSLLGGHSGRDRGGRGRSSWSRSVSAATCTAVSLASRAAANSSRA